MVSSNRNIGFSVGEQNCEELEPAILNPKTRNIAQIIVNSREEAEYMFNLLLGSSVPPRRKWLLEHSEEASDNIW
jgi:DNA gyrase subunit B